MKLKQETIEKLKKAFNVEKLTIEEFKDKYGLMIFIKELGITCYKREFDSQVDRYIEEYQYANSKEALAKLKAIERKDNHYAKFFGYREYRVVKAFTAVEPFMGFGALIEFKDNKERRYMYESTLTWHLSGRSKNYDKGNWHYGSSSGRYFTAGGLLDKEVDFIFNGVGFSSKKDMYSRTVEQVLE